GVWGVWGGAVLGRGACRPPGPGRLRPPAAAGAARAATTVKRARQPRIPASIDCAAGAYAKACARAVLGNTPVSADWALGTYWGRTGLPLAALHRCPPPPGRRRSLPRRRPAPRGERGVCPVHHLVAVVEQPLRHPPIGADFHCPAARLVAERGEAFGHVSAAVAIVHAQVERVAEDQGENDAIAVEAGPAEHAPADDRPQRRHLVGHERDELAAGG